MYFSFPGTVGNLHPSAMLEILEGMLLRALQQYCQQLQLLVPCADQVPQDAGDPASIAPRAFPAAGVVAEGKSQAIQGEMGTALKIRRV